MEEIIVREGDQITINIEEYLQLKQDNKLLTIFLIITGTIITIILISELFKFLDKKIR